jgi:hypothetical protein
MTNENINKKELIIAILSFIFLTIPISFLDIIVKIIGIPITILTVPFSKVEDPPEWKWGGNPHKDLTYDGWKFERLPRPFDYIWGSNKYGLNGNWIWAKYHPTPYWRKVEWVGIRNAASNWSYLPHMRYKAHSDNIRYIGSPKIDDNKGITGWRFTWDATCPWRSGIVILKRYGNSNRAFWLRFGWLQYSDKGDHVPSVKSMFIPHFFKEIPQPK